MRQMRQRIYTIAVELGVKSKVLLEKCQALGISVKNHMSYIQEGDIQLLKRAVAEEKKEAPAEEVLREGIIRRKGVKPPPPPTVTKLPEVTTPAKEVKREKAPEIAAKPPEAALTKSPTSGEISSELKGPKILGRIDLKSRAEAGKLPRHTTAEVGKAKAPMTEQQVEPSGGRLMHPKPQQLPAGQRGSKPLAPSQQGRRFEVIKTEPMPWEPRIKKPRKKKVAPGVKVKKTEITVPKASKRVVKIEGKIRLQDLAKAMSIKATQLLMKLIQMGMSNININSTLDADTAKIVAAEYNYEVEDVAIDEEGLLEQSLARGQDEEAFVPRPPVVTVMGHVDHGKTSLLDRLRNTNMAEKEAGGITQRIGASVVETEKGKIIFIDTPGHEAFTAMRARGAKVTDMALLVVAANDGVQQQTIESINHAKAAGVPIIVAINKIDLPNINIDRIKNQLSEHSIVSEQWGGENLFCEVSAVTGQGLDKLKEAILLQAEILELKTNPSRPGHGIVIESRLDRAKGPIATVIIRNGTMKHGDYVVAGKTQGRIRAMMDWRSKNVGVATPETPVEILGLDKVPDAGDPVDVITDTRKAQWIVDSRIAKATATASTSTAGEKEMLIAKMEKEGTSKVDIVVKADQHGVMEAVKNSILKLSSEKVHIDIIHCSVGAINESDVLLASASKGMIIGFNVRPAGKAKSLADREKVTILLHTIIYEMIDDLRNILKGMITPEYEEIPIGKAKVVKTFKIAKVGNVAGCTVIEGKVVKEATVRVVRDGAVVWTGKILTLKHFKDDVKEVSEGQECGICLDGFQDIKPDDEFEIINLKEKEVRI